ncbi:MAG: carbon-nitrogen hydrolase family protein [Spirochaetes bacterium]|nr:carbon-nitrogen hydrolase family protein [Spirochaetota bacterium]
MAIYPNPYKIALIQADFPIFDLPANLQKAESKVREAASNNAELICLPEAFNTGYDSTKIPEMIKAAETESGQSLSRMMMLAKELGVHLLAPIYWKAPNGGVENRAFLIDDGGAIIGGASKTHPVGDERKFLQRGNQYPVFETKLGKIGIAVCYDACFPETSRILALSGAQLLLVPSAWRGNFYFKEWWDINLACRALDNLFYVAAVNMCGKTSGGEQYFAGKSQVRNPTGELAASCGIDEEAIVYATIDLSRLKGDRAFNTVLEDRHPEDYAPVLNGFNPISNL